MSVIKICIFYVTYACIHQDMYTILYAVTSKRLKLPIFIKNTYCTALQNSHLHFIRNSNMSLIPLQKLGPIFKFTHRTHLNKKLSKHVISVKLVQKKHAVFHKLKKYSQFER